MCAVTPPAVLTLPMDQRAAGRARAFLRQASCSTHTATVLAEAQLLVSELVTNAVRYGTPPIRLEIECEQHAGLTVRVSDAEPTQPVAGTATDDDESGRGVALVDLISDAWGIDPAPPGKAVWFRLNTCPHRSACG